MHVSGSNKKETDYIINLAKQRGFTKQSKLVEYAVFYSQRNIKAKEAPNFHVYDYRSFAKECGVSEPPTL